ncbi:MAG: N-acetyltransferase [Bacteroidia bacterium]|nr:GNAT family N-acetyltransferase [Bacteroidales bacterium]NCD41010.1 N-acetyltransferase [Bacteroidia bacterium]MDD2323955.1 GNAT family N-acetyltransferase [Bacteroidales bacterium]MDD3010477.1 GNAT family N-acetyltransferase [Bacteroidales bacterium]MDD3961058.1 GNAT family N-acetyltransferase [Bacteroidales bacterium]
MVLYVDQEIELHQLQSSDAADIFHAIDTQRSYLGIWLPFVAVTQSVADSEAFVDSVVNAPAANSEPVFAIRKKGAFVGLAGFNHTDPGNHKTEIGYWLSAPWQKQGIMTKTVGRLCDYAFNELNMNRIQIKCAIGNTASRSIPIRLGFSFEGIERQGELLTGNVFADLEVYSRLKSDP